MSFPPGYDPGVVDGTLTDWPAREAAILAGWRPTPHDLGTSPVNGGAIKLTQPLSPTGLASYNPNPPPPGVILGGMGGYPWTLNQITSGPAYSPTDIFGVALMQYKPSSAGWAQLYAVAVERSWTWPSTYPQPPGFSLPVGAWPRVP